MDYLDFYKDLLLEHTKEILPDIFAAIEAEKDPMSGVHFSRGIPKNKPADIPRLHGKSRLPHLGINKSPGHNDPLGIYAFPKKYVLSGGLKYNSGFYNSDYWYIIRPIRSKCKILNLSKLTDVELGELLKKMEIPEKYLTDPSVYHNSKIKTPGHMLWGIMEKYKKDNKNWNNFGWNKLFKKADVNVLVDEGDSIIHSNEPSQTVYMEPGTYEVIKTGSRRAKSSTVLADVIKQFPEYRAIRRNRAYAGNDETYIVTLTHPKLRGIQIQLEYYESSTPDLTVTIYGFGDTHRMKYTNYEGLYGQDYSYHLDPEKIAADIKNFIETNKDKYKPDYTNDLNARDSQIMKKISEYYKIALNPRNFRSLTKQYSHRGYPVKFELMAYDNKLRISLDRYQQYSSYNYSHVSGIDYTLYGGDVEAIMKAAFKSLEDQIESTTPYQNEWAFDINKTDALRTIKFLRDRVFVARKQ